MRFFSSGFKVQALRLQGLYFPPLLHDYIQDFHVLRDDDMLLALYIIFQRKHGNPIFIDVVLSLKDFLDIKDVLLSSHENLKKPMAWNAQEDSIRNRGEPNLHLVW